MFFLFAERAIDVDPSRARRLLAATAVSTTGQMTLLVFNEFIYAHYKNPAVPF